VQFVTKKEDLNKMRLSRYKMERYVYVRKGVIGGGGGEKVCFLVFYIFIYLFNNTVSNSCSRMIIEQQV